MLNSNSQGSIKDFEIWGEAGRFEGDPSPSHPAEEPRQCDVIVYEYLMRPKYLYGTI